MGSKSGDGRTQAEPFTDSGGNLTQTQPRSRGPAERTVPVTKHGPIFTIHALKDTVWSGKPHISKNKKKFKSQISA
ncbi:hypothetical protein Cfor_06478, partial [Coptotermes formosanus]